MANLFHFFLKLFHFSQAQKQKLFHTVSFAFETVFVAKKPSVSCCFRLQGNMYIGEIFFYGLLSVRKGYAIYGHALKGQLL